MVFFQSFSRMHLLRFFGVERIYGFWFKPLSHHRGATCKDASVRVRETVAMGTSACEACFIVALRGGEKIKSGR